MEIPLSSIARLALGAVALLHEYILVLEMVFWNHPVGRKAIHLTAEFAAATKTLAANQGLYNGFLAAGLFWGFTPGLTSRPVSLFFLGCVTIAGLFGALTSSRKIPLVQAVPGAVATALVLLG